MEELGGQAGDDPPPGARRRRQRRGTRAAAPGTPHRPRRRRAQGRVRARRLPRPQRARCRPGGRRARGRRPRRRSARPSSSRCATPPPRTRTCARCSPASTPGPRSLFTCNGRGRHLFGGPDHDAGLVDELLGPMPARRRVLRRRDRPGRRPQLPPRLHRQPRPVPLDADLRSARSTRVDPAGAELRARHVQRRESRRCRVSETRAARHQRDPRAGHGRGAEGELRPPGHADGARAAGARAVHADHALRRERARLARPRPLRPVDRARVDAAVLLLYLTGYGLDARRPPQFRQWGSRTPGHPEYRHAPGIEVTTGPLGQGVANGGRHRARRGEPAGALRARGHRPPRVRDLRRRRLRGGHQPRSGVARRPPRTRAAGRTSTTTTTSRSTVRRSSPTPTTSPKRFEAYGWHVISLGEVANDVDALEAGLRAGMAEAERPSLIVLRSHIGWPSPKYTDTAAAHGNAARRRRGRARSRRSSACPPRTSASPTTCSRTTARPARAARRSARPGSSARWRCATREPGLADEYDACLEQRGLPGWEAKLPSWSAGEQVATRSACSTTLEAIVDVVPGLLAGGADLTGNTGTELKGSPVVGTHVFGGRQIHCGIREHGMGSVMNGMAVSATLPAGGTFFVFSDYERPAAVASPRSPATRPRSSGRTTRSGSARTARRISRSSSSRRCGRCPGSG